MEISFPTDTDGFLSQQCPSCEQRFKVRFGNDGSEEIISYCPYCGHNGQQCWYTPEQVKHIQLMVTDAVFKPKLKNLERQLRRTPNNFLKINMKSDLEKATSPPMEIDDPILIMHFQCCHETIKAFKHKKHFCIICGTEIDMAKSDAKRIFLSHKGVDKSEVKDYQKTLELLGYIPWIDEDAMPAGTSLERGLLKGMQDSCGVVFFITPSFKDEGFLETEVDHAIKEKRKKGEKFAIIALQFKDKDGNIGQIPELLKSYVWKQPKSSLEALQEIVRALPIEIKLIDWRDSITGVITTPIANSTSTELSQEAKAILKAAAANNGNGLITYLRQLNGQEISTNGKSLIPNDDPRTVALQGQRKKNEAVICYETPFC